MFIDLHTHSVSSDDSRANVDQYVKWVGVLRRKGSRIDGFVLTEHRKFDFDKSYSELGEANDVLIMKGSELDTNMGHFLVYGVTEALTDAINFGDVNMDALELVGTAEEHGAIGASRTSRSLRYRPVRVHRQRARLRRHSGCRRAETAPIALESRSARRS